MNPQEFLDALNEKRWIALSALVIGLLVRLVKDDTRLPTVPSRWRPPLALGLGVADGVLNHVAGGMGWRPSLEYGIVAGMLAIAGHGIVVKSVLDGREVPMPRALSIRPPKLESKIPRPPRTPSLADILEPQDHFPDDQNDRK